MSTRPMSRRTKALTLAPLALLSGVWTASLVTASATATPASGKPGNLPDGTSVPSEAIEAPASVPVPGVIAPAVPQGSADAVVSGASSNGIPAPALAAYQRGAQIIDAADKSCNIPWELIAAIGRVESDHGRYGGNTLTTEGVSKPGIFGIALNGKNGTQAINDTDGGQLDKDAVYDRAVGPMQFIPSTWQVVKVDADGDGQRNPQDMDDAALATAVYLCSGKDNLSSRPGQEAAVYRYNHSKDYVNLVLRIMEAYSQGDYTAVPSGTYGGTSFSPSYSSAIEQRYTAAKQREARQKAAKKRAAASSSSSSAPAAPATRHRHHPRHQRRLDRWLHRRQRRRHRGRCGRRRGRRRHGWRQRRRWQQPGPGSCSRPGLARPEPGSGPGRVRQPRPGRQPAAEQRRLRRLRRQPDALNPSHETPGRQRPGVSSYPGRLPPVTPPPPFVHRHRVRYVECDMQGIVFNAHYYTWIDIAHTEWIRRVAGPLGVLHEQGVDVVVAESSCRYRAPAHFDDDLDVEVRLTALSTTSMTTTHTFRRGEDVLAVGTVRHVCVTGPPYSKLPWPDTLRALFDAELVPAEE